MPSSVDQTNTSSVAHSTTLLSNPTPVKPSPHSVSWYDPASNFGYGIGRLLRGTFDSALGAWQSWWNPNPVPSLEEIAQRQQAIYVAGLKECIHHLKSALENIRKNPSDPASLRKVDDLAQHYAAYVNVAPAMELNVVQQQLFQPIREQVERLTNPSLKQKLKTLLPVLSIGISVRKDRKTDTSWQDEEYSIGLSQSYYDEENTVKKSSESSSSKEKRSIEQTPFPAVFDLSTLDGSNGFTIPGVTTAGYLGQSVSSAGDINGDGITDLVFGAWGTNSGNGTSYVLFGSHSSFPAVVNLAALNGSNGFSVPGITSGAYLGYSVSSAGDVNGDNITDLVLGAYAANLNGTSYVIFGNHGGFSAIFDLSALNGSNGFSVPGIASSGGLGVSVSSVGDVNGDNITDFVLGAYAANSLNGTSYVIFGSRNPFPTVFNLHTLNGSNGFSVPGIASNGQLGISVATAGDMNGDNITDLVLGASSANSGNGTSYVIFGSRNGFPAVFNLRMLNGSNGFSIPGIASSGYLGRSVSTAGDINGDDITDLVLGAPGANSYAGASYVVFGNRNPFPPSFNLSTLNGSNGFVISAGSVVSTAGDVNGDNITDLVLGAPGANSNNGTSYVIFGSRTPFPTSFSLTNLNGSNGFVIPGIAVNGFLGISVTTAGDINGDNIKDLVLGAYNASSSVGASYVIFGQKTIATPTPIPAPVQIGTIDWVIQANGTTILTPGQFQVIGNSTQLANDIFTVEVSHGGYFAASTNLTVALTNFTYPQLEAGQILFVHQGTQLPNITLSVGDGIGQPILFSPVISFSNDNSPSNVSPSSLRVIAGAAAGAVSFAALLTAVGIAAHHRRAKEKEKEKAAHPIRNLASVATPLQRKGN